MKDLINIEILKKLSKNIDYVEKTISDFGIENLILINKLKEKEIEITPEIILFMKRLNAYKTNFKYYSNLLTKENIEIIFLTK